MRTLSIGDRCPFLRGRTLAGPNLCIDHSAGRYLVLAFFHSARHPIGARFLQALPSIAHHFDDRLCSFFGISIDPEDKSAGRFRDAGGISFLMDTDRSIGAAFGVVSNPAEDAMAKCLPCVFVINPRFQIAAVLPMSEPEACVARLGALLDDSLPTLTRTYAAQPQAPVLAIPQVFEPELCRLLISLFEADGGGESGFMQEREGLTVGVLDDRRKRRRDYYIENADLRRMIDLRMSHRIVPEIVRAFHLRTTRIERYLVARYDGSVEGGFAAHRDNTLKGTRHRQFAVSINLSDDYDGGHLCFPEFGPALHREPAGAAVVFSCSLLHEARPVTQGHRFVFLTFLYDDAQAGVRQANTKYLSSDPPKRIMETAGE